MKRMVMSGKRGLNGAQPACCTAGLSQTPENNKSHKSAPLISNLLVIREYRHENRIYWPCLIKKELTRGEKRRGEPFLYFFSLSTFWSETEKTAHWVLSSRYRLINLLFTLRPISTLLRYMSLFPMGQPYISPA